jgi:tetratricopeptide (TPR) repeat protein
MKAVVSWGYDWDGQASETEFRLAGRLNPGSATVASYHAFELATAGRFEDAIGEVRRAVELDPTSLSLAQQMAYFQVLKRNSKQAEVWARRALELNPEPLFARAMLITALSLQGSHVEATTEYAKIPAGSLTAQEQLAGAYVAFACVRAGRTGEANKILGNIQREIGRRYVDPYLLASIAGNLGDRESMLRWLNQAREERSMSMTLLGVEPLFDSVRAQKAVRAIAEQVGLPFQR